MFPELLCQFYSNCFASISSCCVQLFLSGALIVTSANYGLGNHLNIPVYIHNIICIYVASMKLYCIFIYSVYAMIDVVYILLNTHR